MNRKILSLQIDKNSFSIDEAANWLESIKMATTKKYYAILMDIAMPSMDWIEATKLLRAKWVNSKIIWIWCSNYDAAASLNAWMNGFLVKPIDMKKLNWMLAE
jgi:CheY-like chemotaxis protein